MKRNSMKLIVLDSIRITALAAKLSILLLLMTGLPSHLAAQDLPERITLPLALASEAAQAALTACEKQGYRVSVAVVDHAGLLKALLTEGGWIRASYHRQQQQEGLHLGC